MSRRALVGLVFTVLAGGSLVARWSNTAILQPIAFNHLKHSENGLECSACHQHFDSSSRAGRPENATCLLCHETPLGNSAEERSFHEYARRKEEVPWRRLTVLPTDVYFSHRTHVLLAKAECRECHGDIGRSSVPPPTAEIEMSMERCIECHESRKASVDCLSCHR